MMIKLKLTNLFIALIFLFFSSLKSQNLVHHTTNYFGPNANQVPDFTDAKIPKNTNFTLIGDYYFGFGDQTVNPQFQMEIPLIPEKVSVKLWMVPLEYYKVTDEIRDRRAMLKNSGIASGDVYFQTRISLLSEEKRKIAVILNATLKTASGSEFKNRRFFNTAGYYFDTEIGKSFFLTKSFLEEIRLVADAGFYSWDVLTPNNNIQDDAVMYGLKMILKRKNISWENTFSGYYGWLNRVSDYGDTPQVLATKLNIQSKKNTYFIQYQYGIRYFPFHQIRLGATFSLPFLNPKFF